MPSALSCDPSHQNAGNRLQAALFSSPPSSPPTTSQSTLNNLFTTCRALQSMLTSPSTAVHHTTTPEDASASHPQLPTPPMAHATLPTQPLKLRLRSRRPDSSHSHSSGGGNSSPGGEGLLARRRIVKRTPPRGANKRRRATDDDMGRDDDIDSDLDIAAGAEEGESSSGPRTPKRARIAPEIMPLGLDRSDFHNLQLDSAEEDDSEDPTSTRRRSTGDMNCDDNREVEVEMDGEEWSTEEDRILVELVLEKLKLTKSDWQQCARSLGKDRMSIGRRWKSLMVSGDVGLKSRSRRSKIHGTWR